MKLVRIMVLLSVLSLAPELGDALRGLLMKIISKPVTCNFYHL